MIQKTRIDSLLFLGCMTLLLVAVSAQTDDSFLYDKPFVDGATYDESIPHPDDILGFRLGARPATHQEILRYFEALSRSCEHVRLFQYGETHEERSLVYLVISSPENMKQLEPIKSKIRQLANPQVLRSEEDAEAIIQETPAVAWMAYSIHGDELSSSDAAVWTAYQLAAGRDAASEAIRRNVLVCIDPLQNPDGRERFLTQVRMFNGKVLNPDVQSAHHAGMWPWGRGNHYFFDLNRDFIILTQPETRARIRIWREYNPQLLVDSHEMGPLNTYLFSPSREPINPYLPSLLDKWSPIFAQEQGRAFDRYGWSYYTREWVDNWYPGYTDWISYTGAIQILYEQAGVDGSAVRRHDGSAMTYRESVHHHIVSSLANLRTLAERREDVLRDYYTLKKQNIDEWRGDEIRAYIIDPGENRSRDFTLLDNLQLQGIEVYESTSSFTLPQVRSTMGEIVPDRKFPAGSWIVSTRQPLKNLINAVMEFDPRMTDAFLKEERFYLEKKNESRLYDVSSWSMPIAYGVRCYSATVPVEVSRFKYTGTKPESGAPDETPAYGYVLNGSDDAATFAVVQLLEEGVAVRAAEKEFRVGENTFPRGSFLLRKAENKDNLQEIVQRIAEKHSVEFYGADTALDLDGVDLGGGFFGLLTCPRIAAAMGRGISTTSYGALWNILDDRYRVRVSSLDADRLSSLDLRKYNVLILPSGSYDKDAIPALKQWVTNGGTLIALGSAATPLTQEKAEMSQVRERRDVLEKLDEYEEAAEREENALIAEASQKDVWDYAPGLIEEASPSEKEKKPAIEKLKRQDEWERRFSPNGAFLRTGIDPYHWLTYGVREPLAVMVGSSRSFYSKPPVETPVRFTGEASIRVSGLLWPEARKRFAKSAYLTRERMGRGQIILFPFEPHMRAYFPETTRLLWNAVFLGPGLGAQTPIPW